MTLIEYMVEKEQLRREWAEDLNTKQPEDLHPYDDVKAWWRCEKGHEWQARIKARAYSGQNCPYCAGRRVTPGVNDLATTHPQVAAQWHPDLNGGLTPSDVLTGSGMSAWWLCEKGHKWKSTISNRTVIGSGCPVCAKKTHLANGNDLATASPELAAQWHPTLNGDLKPEMVSPGSAKRVWWRCEKGHEWRCTVTSRAKVGTGCPYCAGLRIIPGENDLVTLSPDVAAEWDYELNGDTDPRTISCYSRRKFWWRCEKGHSWQTAVAVRTVGKSKCPNCSGRHVPGENDLKTRHPSLMKEWHPTLNGDLKPETLSPYSSVKVWWCCKHGHEWQATVGSRVKGSGCPYCSGRKAVPGEKDLATLNPEIAKDWHPTRNGDSKPSDVSPKSRKQIWWRCEKGHEWEAAVFARVTIGTGCPYCAGKRAISGENDLATLRPDLASQWHPTLNGDLKPTDVKTGSAKRVWWRCERGHEWDATVGTRNKQKGPGCPVCTEKTGSSESLIAKTPAKPKDLPRPQSTT